MSPKHTSAREQLALELIRHAEELARTNPGSGISMDIALTSDPNCASGSNEAKSCLLLS